MGKVRYVLGLKIVRNHPKRLMGMCQEVYFKSLLECFWMHSAKLADTPVKKGLSLSLNQYLKTNDDT